MVEAVLRGMLRLRPPAPLGSTSPPSSTNTSLAPLYAWSPKGQRARCKVPRTYGPNVTLFARTTHEGIGPCLVVEGATTREVFETYIEQRLGPALRPGQIVVIDNLSSHKSERVRELIEERGCELLYLPPYSPDLNPIEEAFAKVEGLLREAEVRTREALVETIGTALSAVTLRDAWGFFKHCGYPIRRFVRCLICSFCVPDGALDPSNVN